MKDFSGQEKEDQEPTKARILKAAEDLFADKGYKGTTAREIAKRADVNIALINYHWGSKEELWNAVNQSLVKVGNEVVAQLFEKYPKLENHEDLVGITSLIIDFMAEYPNVIKVGNVLGSATGPDTWTKETDQIIFESFREYIRECTPLDFDPVSLDMAVFCTLGAFIVFFDRPGMTKLYFGEDSADLSVEFRKRIATTLSTMIERNGMMA